MLNGHDFFDFGRVGGWWGFGGLAGGGMRLCGDDGCDDGDYWWDAKRGRLFSCCRADPTDAEPR